MDQLDRIIAYEQGELDQDETIELFQELINTGLAWSLQGHYGRTAAAMIEAGYCKMKAAQRVQKYQGFSQAEVERKLHDAYISVQGGDDKR
jgi:hypothetical protein